jgi:Double zinc ribbon
MLQCSCGRANPDNARFCEECGKELSQKSKTCKACHAPCAVEASFCPSCGAAFAPVDPSNAPSTSFPSEAATAKTDGGRSRSKAFGFWGFAAVLLILGWLVSPSLSQTQSCEFRTRTDDRYKCNQPSSEQMLFFGFGVASIIAGFGCWPKKRREGSGQ